MKVFQGTVAQVTVHHSALGFEALCLCFVLFNRKSFEVCALIIIKWRATAGDKRKERTFVQPNVYSKH